MRECLDGFCSMSGHMVSYEKSQVLCSPNVKKSDDMLLAQTCGSPLTQDIGKYLSVPLIHNRINESTYSEVIDKVKKKADRLEKCYSIDGW